MTTGDRLYAAAPSVVWRPGGKAVGNVYTTSSAAWAAARTTLYTKVLIDDTIVSPAVMDPVEHDATGIGWIVGANEFTPAVVTVSDGTTFTWSNYWGLLLENVFMQFDGASASPVEVPANGLYLEMQKYATISCGASSVPFFHCANGRTLFSDVYYACKLLGSLGHEVVGLDSGGGAILKFASQAQLSPDALTGGDAGAFTVVDTSATTLPTSTADISHTQTGANAPSYLFGFQS